jgi:hypothetical protein
MIECSACHGGTASTPMRDRDDANDRDEGRRHENLATRPASPGNSAFGHSHKRDKYHGRGNDD